MTRIKHHISDGFHIFPFFACSKNNICVMCFHSFPCFFHVSLRFPMFFPQFPYVFRTFSLRFPHVSPKKTYGDDRPRWEAAVVQRMPWWTWRAALRGASTRRMPGPRELISYKVVVLPSDVCWFILAGWWFGMTNIFQRASLQPPG